MVDLVAASDCFAALAALADRLVGLKITWY